MAVSTPRASSGFPGAETFAGTYLDPHTKTIYKFTVEGGNLMAWGEALQRVAANQYYDLQGDIMTFAHEINSWRDLQGWFLAQLDLQKRYEMTRGCPFGILANEVTDNDELVRQDLSLIFEVVKNKLAAFFVREKAKRNLVRRANPEHMADFCIASIQGAMLMGKVRRSSQTVETTVQEALVHLKSYLVKA